MQNINSKSLEYEVVLYFDLQPHPMTRALGSVLALQGAYFWNMNAFWRLTDMI